MKKDSPLSPEASEYANRLFACVKPCDSFGICDGCAELVIFRAGYNFGARSGLVLGRKEAEPLTEALWAVTAQRGIVALSNVDRVANADYISRTALEAYRRLTDDNQEEGKSEVP